MFKRGYIHLYTGDGKGKTTAAVGLAIRALGAGLKVAFLQFFKPPTSSEVTLLKLFKFNLYYANFHTHGFVKGTPTLELKREIEEGFSLFKELLYSKFYNLFILDEFTYALNWKVIEMDKFINLLKEKPKEVEIVITGRNAPQELIEIADLITEMRAIKHYFEIGVKARCGIEK